MGWRTWSEAALVTTMILAAQPGLAESGPAPVYKDTERFDEPAYRLQNPGSYPARSAVTLTGGLRPATRVVGDTDYSGSVYGLGKPQSGIGTRPDWGRSNP